MKSGFTRRGSLLASVVLLVIAADARGQAAPLGQLQLPTDPAAWINADPISLQVLAGKGVVLWFYEEGCPRSRAKWPELLEVAKKYRGKPVVFIAVNSGNSRGDVERYARDVGLTWPVIVDTNRDFERMCGVGEINMQNIYQPAIITHDGKVGRGRWDDVPGTADTALSGAQWEVDPTGIPAALEGAWLAIEFGNPAGAAMAVKKGLASSNVDVKAAATRLNDAVQAKIKVLVDAAKNADQEGDKWAAYKSCKTLLDRYGGYDVPPELRTMQKQLGEDDVVKKQVLARKVLDSAARPLLSPEVSVRRGAITKLKKLAADYPDTDAAAEAHKLIAEFGG